MSANVSIPFLLLLSLFVSCNEAESARSTADTSLGEYTDQIELEPPRSAEPPPPREAAREAKIIKQGALSLDVDTLSKAKIQLDGIVTRFGAYYENEAYRSDYRANHFDLSMRVPVGQFDSVVTALESGPGKLTAKKISARDVTEEFVDLEIRLENKLAYLTQYQEILTGARTIEEVLQVQEKIRALEEEIESRKGRLRYLESQVRYSKLQVTLTEYVAAEPESGPGLATRLGDAVAGGGALFVSLFVSLVYLWPLLLLGVLVGIGVFWRRRRSKRRS